MGRIVPHLWYAKEAKKAALVNVPDSYEFTIRIPTGETLKYSSKVLKYWEHDLEALYKNNNLT